MTIHERAKKAVRQAEDIRLTLSKMKETSDRYDLGKDTRSIAERAIGTLQGFLAKNQGRLYPQEREELANIIDNLRSEFVDSVDSPREQEGVWH